MQCPATSAEAEPKPMSPDQIAHEQKCRRCAKCCKKKIVVGEWVFYASGYCKHLDPETKLCRVYDRRHEVNPRCAPVEEGLKFGIFPASCPYTQEIVGYRPPIEGNLGDEIMERIRAGEIASDDDVEDFLRERLGEDFEEKLAAQARGTRQNDLGQND